MNRRDFSAQLAATGFAASSLFAAGRALAQGGPVEGKQYKKIDPPVPATATGKIEVIEFFSYGCPHCNAFEPLIAAWSKKLPADVSFTRLPVPFLANFENLMRTYYALEALGQIDAMQRKVFTAIHVERNTLEKPADIAALMAKNGVDAAKFASVFSSFSVASSVTRAKKIFAQYKIESVPTVAINGRFETSPADAGGLEQALSVTDYLIQRARIKA